MKKILLLLFLAAFATSCVKDDATSDNNGSGDNPDKVDGPKPEYDENSFGIYKGVLVGDTSGTILIDINNDNQIYATLTINGVSYKFTTTDEVVEGEDINGIVFKNGTKSFEFYVYYDGTYPEVFNIELDNDPNATVLLTKEDSKHVVKCYEGSYSKGGVKKGTINIIRYMGATSSEYDIYTGLVKQNNDDYVSSDLTGEDISTPVELYDGYVGITFDLETYNNKGNITGTWYDDYDDTLKGAWSATLKL